MEVALFRKKRVRDIVGRSKSMNAPCTLLEGMRCEVRTREKDSIHGYTRRSEAGLDTEILLPFICNRHPAISGEIFDWLLFEKMSLVDCHFLYEFLTEGHSSVLIDGGDRGIFREFSRLPLCIAGAQQP